MKKAMTTICAAVLALALHAATDMGVIVTTKNIGDVASVVNGSGGTATITVADTNGVANAVTVYNKTQLDTALSGKAAASDVTALQTRATALESATNALNSAVETIGSGLSNFFTDDGGTYLTTAAGYAKFYADKIMFHYSGGHGTEARDWTVAYPTSGGDFALFSDITNTVPAWARASSKPTYTFSEITSKPTTISGYGITDAKIENGTITLGGATITPLTGFTETDPVWTADKSSYSTTTQMNTAIQNATNGLAKASALSSYVPTTRKVQGKALSADVTVYGSEIAMASNDSTKLNAAITALRTATNTLNTAVSGKVGLSQLTVNASAITSATTVELGQYYIATVDGKPHLMLR